MRRCGGVFLPVAGAHQPAADVRVLLLDNLVELLRPARVLAQVDGVRRLEAAGERRHGSDGGDGGDPGLRLVVVLVEQKPEVIKAMCLEGQSTFAAWTAVRSPSRRARSPPPPSSHHPPPPPGRPTGSSQSAPPAAIHNSKLAHQPLKTPRLILLPTTRVKRGVRSQQRTSANETQRKVAIGAAETRRKAEK